MDDLSDLIAQRDLLNARIAASQLAAKAETIAKVRTLMQETGLTPEDLGFASRTAAKKPVRKVPPKYRDAEGRTWTGRGFQPQFVREHMERYGSLDGLLIRE